MFVYILFIIIILLPLIIWIILDYTKYSNTSYAKCTKASYGETMFNKGRYGEYKTFCCLNKLNGHKRFLFNCYIPKDNNTTTEIDVIMIHSTGIYVFESKNYSGWIFGSESQKNWTQTLPKGKTSLKSHFFNPIIQNKIHIKWLNNYLNVDNANMFHSIIVFSERCQLKRICLTTNENIVIKRNYLHLAMKDIISNSPQILTDQQIDDIFNRLFPLTQVSEQIKIQHINNINQTYKASVPQPVIKAAINNTQIQQHNDSRICPRCKNGTIILRIAKKGQNAGQQFWGCSNYPKCRYTEKINTNNLNEDSKIIHKQ